MGGGQGTGDSVPRQDFGVGRPHLKQKRRNEETGSRSSDPNKSWGGPGPDQNDGHLLRSYNQWSDQSKGLSRKSGWREDKRRMGTTFHSPEKVVSDGLSVMGPRVPKGKTDSGVQKLVDPW